MARASLGILLAVVLGACGYSLTGRGVYLPEHIRKVAVPLLGNDTYEFQLASSVTFELADRLARHRELTVVSLEEADAALEGKILSYVFQPVSVDRSGTAQLYRITIRAELAFRDLVRKRVHWQNPNYTFSLDYDVPGDLGSREETEQDVQREVAQEMAEDVVEQILEGF